ncbi:C6 and c2h2 transcription factor [Lasiodiplodia theobromae]|uniref:C6 and c2h2 transcription factor n=1 Tax=Lasiodiplodia theobromae TaxID=45133 RepID=UPI0015C387D8|nr:C6 and c2h2 transcription factor [Lasiodiplodia theobromae]KAF4536192.1 C6 and c2h2 transcription factor [Lasiodiplodia theobromae]
MSYKSLGHLRRASGEDTNSTEIPLVTESENRSQTSAKEAAKRRYEDWWFWEISSAVVSIASVMAIIILGVSIDQTALSDWTFILGPVTAPRADIQGAFLSGIFNGGSHFDFVCQSGNCTWDDFYSMGTDGDVQPLSIDPIPFRTPPKGYNHSDLYGPGGHELPSFAITPAAADSLPSTLPPFDSNRFDVSVGDHEIIRSFVRRMLNFTFVNQDQLTVASAFAYGVDVAALMGNMTDSLTNLIRTGPNATVVEGVVLRPETFISVQWAWLALPIALVLLSAAFLVATLLVSRRHSVPLWKSGLLPYIFHNELAGEWKEEERRAIYEGRVNKRPEMERRARGIGAKLTWSEEGETRLVRI